MKKYLKQSNSFLIHLYKFLRDYKSIFIYLPLVVYWIILFTLTTIPADKMPQLFANQDKVEHLLAYFVLAFLLAFTLSFQNKIKLLSSRAVLFTVIFVAAYGALDELHQMFIPGRECDFYDWLSDLIGGSLGALAALYILNKFPIKPEGPITEKSE